MNKEKIQKIVIEKIAEILQVNPVNDMKAYEKSDCDLMKDIGLDSILLIQLVVELENIFGITFELERMEIEQVRNFNKLIDYISKQNKIT
ncbi:MAG: acyl carrier protein [Eubacterium sp.]|nr:acyl carrier protein [Eubacterium sp.]